MHECMQSTMLVFIVRISLSNSNVNAHLFYCKKVYKTLIFTLYFYCIFIKYYGRDYKCLVLYFCIYLNFFILM